MLLSVLYVHFRDIQPIWEVAPQILFYASPVIISIETVSGEARSPTCASHCLHAQPARRDLPAVPPCDGHARARSAPARRSAAGRRLLIPLASSLAIFAVGFWFFNRAAPRRSRRTCERGGAARPIQTSSSCRPRSSGCARASTALEAELVEVQARANAAVAQWQERAYWLDRWHLDLNALMRRPGAAEFRAALRAVRRSCGCVQAGQAPADAAVSERLGRGPRQGRGALPGGAARGAAPRGGRRDARDRLGLRATARCEIARVGRRRAARDRPRRSSRTGAPATSAPNGRAAS